MNDDLLAAPQHKAGHNSPEMSVGDLAFSLKKTLEETFGSVRVRGELSRVTIARSGHMYSSLKDDLAVIDAVCWKGVMAKLSVQPEEGLEVIVTGKISSYPQRSNYQLIIESMELAGEGALLKMLEQRKKKLAAEGIFDEGRKKKLPFLPEVIGVVTSPTGAVIRDIMHRLRDRFPRHVLLAPVLVQGNRAADQVSAAIDAFNQMDSHGDVPKPDLLIIARGGGSLEDLMPFNEENVVRAVARSDIPVISAVGHETDTTLCDYAADVRAPTPTGAAEMAVPMRVNLMAQIQDNSQRLSATLQRRVEHDRKHFENLAARLGSPDRLFDVRTQRLDHISSKLDHVFDRRIQTARQRFTQAGAKLRLPSDKIGLNRQKIEQISQRLGYIRPKLTENSTNRLSNLTKMLEMLSYNSVLSRGYAVVRDENGQPICDGAQVGSGQLVQIQFRDVERVDAVIGSEGVNMPVDQARRDKPKKKNVPVKSKKDQGSLF